MAIVVSGVVLSGHELKEKADGGVETLTIKPGG
jgi:hypothetical protein